VVWDLTTAKKVEERAAQFYVAPVITRSGVEVGTASIASGGECLNAPVVSSQEEPAEYSVVEAAGVSPPQKEDAPSPATNGDSYPDKGLAEPVQEVLVAVVPEVSWARWNTRCG